MGIFKNDKQRENVAKYCYDVLKLLAVTVGVTPFIKGERIFDCILGVVAAIIFFVLGYTIDWKEYK